MCVSALSHGGRGGGYIQTDDEKCNGNESLFSILAAVMPGK